MKKLFMALVVSATAILGTSAHASTLNIFGGATDITVTADLRGLLPALTGSATANADGSFRFPITGGSTDGVNALIEHDGSGVSLTGMVGGSSVTATISDFLIDTNAGLVTGVLTGNSGVSVSDVAFFSIVGLSARGAELAFTDALAAQLNRFDFVGAPFAAGEEFGFAVPDPQVVPLPAGAVLLLTGLGALVLRARQAKG